MNEVVSGTTLRDATEIGELRLAFVGEAPGRCSEARPFDGPTGTRLARVCGVSSIDALRTRVKLVNLYSGRPDRWDRASAREAARRLMRSELVDRDLVFLCGRRVADAFCLRGYRYFLGDAVNASDEVIWSFPWIRATAADFTVKWCVVVPHPSGASRWWNSPTNRTAAETYLRGILSSERLPLFAMRLDERADQ